MTATLLLGELPKITHQPWAHCYEVSWAVNGEGYPECFLSTRTAPIVERKEFSNYQPIGYAGDEKRRRDEAIMDFYAIPPVATYTETRDMAYPELRIIHWTWWKVTL